MNEDKLMELFSGNELSDQELEKVAGGRFCRDSFEWMCKYKDTIVARSSGQVFLAVYNRASTAKQILTVDDVKAIFLEYNIDVNDLE